MNNFLNARKNMVLNQVTPNIHHDDKLTGAIFNIERDLFLPAHLKHLSYTDNHVSLDRGRHLMSPMLLAKLIQEVGIKASDIVLDLSVGNGYSSAIISKLAKKVVAVESNYKLYQQLCDNVDQLKLDNIETIHTSNMTAGCKEFAPYNIIFIAGALQEVPDSLFGQLEDGGKIITILYKESDYVQNVDSALGTVVMIVKNDDILSKFELFSVNCFTLDLYDNTQKEYTH